MREIGLQVAAAAEREWRQRCAAAGYMVWPADGGCPPPLWLIVLEHDESPQERRLQLLGMREPIILVTEYVQDGSEVAKRLPMPVLVARPKVAAKTLADLCVMVGCMAAGSGRVADDDEAGESDGW